MKKITISIIIVFSFFSLLTNWIPSAKAAGATLYVSPASAKYQVGQTFTMSVLVNSGGGSGINAAEGALKFDPTILKAQSVSKGSLFSLWTEEPKFNNTAGTISFGGGSPSAYKGSSGSIVSISFKVLKAGDSSVSFTSGLVLANDGVGTNILSSYGSGKYTLTEAEKKEEPKVEKPKEETKPKEEETTEKGILPPAPEVISTTHPKDTIWYPNNKPEFKWKLLADVVAVAVSLNEASTSDPGTDSEGIIETKSFDNVKNGVWFIHVKFKNKFGWSQITHKKIMVDSEAPEQFTIKYNDQGDPTNPTPIIDFETIDKVSGVDHYKLIINNESKEVQPTDFKLNPFKTQILPPGEQVIEVIAYDKAGNLASSTGKFIVEPLKMPIITDIPLSVIRGKENLVVRGTSFYPQATIQIMISQGNKDPDIYETKTDNDGNWSFFLDKKLDKGNYNVWAKLIDGRGAQSFDTTKRFVSVVSPSILQSFGWYIIIFLFLLVVAAGLTIEYMRRKFDEERSRIKNEIKETKETVTKVFVAMKEELDEQLEFADTKRGLSEAERRVKERLQEALEIAQEFINKEIDDTEKEIKIKEEK